MSDEDEVAAFWSQIQASQREAALSNPGPSHVVRGGREDERPASPLFDPASIRLDALQWLDQQPPPQRWLLDEVMPEQEVAIFGGAGASSKSQLLLQVGVGVASGAPIADGGLGGALWTPVCPRPVLILTAEDKAEDLHRRIWRIAQHAVRTEAERGFLLRHLYVASVRGMDVRVMFQSRAGGEYLRTATAQRIEALASAIDGVGMVVIEPISRFRGGNEVDNDAATALISWMERLSDTTGANVVTAAHSNKFSSKENEQNQDAIRGATALVAGARWVCSQRVMTLAEAEKWHIPAGERKRWVQLALVKANNVAELGEAWLERGIGGYLMHRDLKHGPREQRPRDAASFDAVVDWICQLVRSHPETKWTVSAIEAKYGRVENAEGPGVGEKRLRQILRVAVDEGVRLRLGPARQLIVVG